MPIMQIANTIVYPELSYKVGGILFAVHNKHGRYCNEKQYADAIEQELKETGIAYEREKVIPESFIGELKGRNKVDFIIEDKIIVEVKSKRVMGKDDYYQLRRYLDAFDKKLGILVNFRDKYLRPKRILNSSVKEN